MATISEDSIEIDEITKKLTKGVMPTIRIPEYNQNFYILMTCPFSGETNVLVDFTRGTKKAVWGNVEFFNVTQALLAESLGEAISLLLKALRFTDKLPVGAEISIVPAMIDFNPDVLLRDAIKANMTKLLKQ